MDFKPMKKDRKAGEDGHFPWESPRLRAAIDAERKAAKPKTCEPKLLDPTWGDANMQRRDLKLEGLAEPRAESVCTHRLKYRNWLQKEYCPQCFACEEKLS